MFTKLKLYFNIKRFYTTFGDEFGPNSAMTNDNLFDVMYDINEALEANSGVWCDEAIETDKWLNKLYEDIDTYRETPQHNFHWDTTLFTVGIILAIAFAIYQVVTAENPWVDKPKAVEVIQEPTRYTAFGRYYTNGTVVTNDGNTWAYTTDTISDKTPYDNMPVWIGLDDNGTPTDITDDIVLGLVFDVYTAIYDDLATSLSESFELERDGNNIRIKEVR